MHKLKDLGQKVCNALVVRRNGLQILCYHRVLDVSMPRTFNNLVINCTPKVFEEEIIFLQRHFNIISIKEAMERIKNKKPWPPNSLAITFDDGYRDNYTYALPILKKYRIPATVFLTTDFIGNRNFMWTDKLAYLFATTQNVGIDIPSLGSYNLNSHRKRWKATLAVTEYLKNMDNETKNNIVGLIYRKLESSLKKEDNERLYLSKEEIAEMSRNNISFGSHGCSHSILTKIDLREAQKEILDSKIKLEEVINGPVCFFAYPNGTAYDFNEQIIGLLKEFGYKAAFTMLLGTNRINDNLDLFSLKRIPAGRSLLDVKKNLFLYS